MRWDPSGSRLLRRVSLDRESVSAADFGRLLRSRRSDAELTQEGLAQKSGVSVRAISDVETGRTDQPRITSVRLLADAIGLSGAERRYFIEAASSARDRPKHRGGSTADLLVPRIPCGDVLRA